MYLFNLLKLSYLKAEVIDPEIVISQLFNFSTQAQSTVLFNDHRLQIQMFSLYLRYGLLLYVTKKKGLIFYCAYQNPTQILLYLVDLMNTFDLQIDRILSLFSLIGFIFLIVIFFIKKMTAFESSNKFCCLRLFCLQKENF